MRSLCSRNCGPWRGSARAGDRARQQKDGQQPDPQPEQPHHAEQPEHDGSRRLGSDERDDGNERVRDAAEEPPDVVRGIRLDDQPEQRAAEQRVHQCRQHEIRQLEIPERPERIGPAHGSRSSRPAQHDGTPPQRAVDPDRAEARNAAGGRRSSCTLAKQSGAPKGPAHDRTAAFDQVFSSSTVLPRGLRISSTKACISFDGSLPSRLTTMITRKPSGIPNSPQLMLLRSNQPTLLASGWASVGQLSMAFGRAMALARSTSGAPVAGFNSELMPKYFTPAPGK